MSSPVREDGIIDEDVNVKERAAIFGGKSHASNNFQNNQNLAEKQNQNLPPTYNRSKSMWTNSSTSAHAVTLSYCTAYGCDVHA